MGILRPFFTPERLLRNQCSHCFRLIDERVATADINMRSAIYSIGNNERQGPNDTQWEQNIEIDFGGTAGDRANPLADKKLDDIKALPPWMLRQGAQVNLALVRSY